MTQTFLCGRRVAQRMAAVALVALLWVAGSAHAGRSCQPAHRSTAQVADALTLAQRTATALNASGAQVVVLARAGQDLTRYGLRYSHLGLAYRTDSGAWRVVHKLNQCGTASAGVYRQGLGEFFLDDLWRYEAAYVVPDAALQQQLLALLQTRNGPLRMHHAPYSVVSYAWGQRYQQSNQWALETLALAAEPDTPNRAAAQTWLQTQGYRPNTLQIDALTRLGGRIGAANIAFDDHPPSRRYAGRIDTVTVESLFGWLVQRGGANGPHRVVLPRV